MLSVALALVLTTLFTAALYGSASTPVTRAVLQGFTPLPAAAMSSNTQSPRVVAGSRTETTWPENWGLPDAGSGPIGKSVLANLIPLAIASLTHGVRLVGLTGMATMAWYLPEVTASWHCWACFVPSRFASNW